MARKQRDYKAEYARRKLLERERSTREGRAFSMSRARGHAKDDSLRILHRVLKRGLQRNVTEDQIVDLARVIANRHGREEPNADDWAEVNVIMKRSEHVLSLSKKGKRRYREGRAFYDDYQEYRTSETKTLFFYH